MRKTKLLYNTLSSLLYQIITIICGFILPRIILQYYGSEVNGLVNSITQFLQVIAFLDLGVGAVVQTALYKPLADKDCDQISKIYKSASKFFKNIARILIVYMIILIIFYPIVVNKSFDFYYTATLIIAMGISYFAQYYFGVVNRLLLIADQNGYIQYNIQIVTLIINTIACIILIKMNVSIQIVKLTTSIIYLARPLLFKYYVDKKYSINKNIIYNVEPINQKWNGVAQHVAAVVIDGTDSIVLTIFSTLTNVSIYGVYNLVVMGVKQLFMSLTNGIQSLIGELWAKQEMDTLYDFFSKIEWMIHMGTIYLFGCTACLIVPFIEVYTYGINDANYIQKSFAMLLVIANGIHCLRIPYVVMILAAGHYKQTQSNYLITAFVNIIVSILLVIKYGLIGVAIGTLVSMLYQTIWMANYVSQKIIKNSRNNFIKLFVTDIMTFIIILFSNSLVKMKNITYMAWILMAVKVAIISVFIMIIINLLFYHKKLFNLFNKK